MMCIVCAASRSARRVLDMLLWIVVPMIISFVFSPFFTPAFRFEFTVPRLCCLAILFLTLFWYEFLEPRILEWKARRRARQRENNKIEKMAATTRLRYVIRRCPNCHTPYRDQGSPKWNKKKKCEHCGVVTKNPKKEVQGFRSGGKEPETDSWFHREVGDSSKESNEEDGHLQDETRLMGENGVEVRGDQLKPKILDSFFLSMMLFWEKIWHGGSSGENSEGFPHTGPTAIAEEVADDKKSKRYRAQRKAEEKRKAREIKEKEEEQEKKDREEVAKLVEAFRRLKEEEHEAGTESMERDREIGKGKDVEWRGLERTKEKDRVSSKDKASSDGEDAKKRAAGGERKKSFDSDNKDTSGRQDIKKATIENANLAESLRAQNAVRVGVSSLDHHEVPSHFPSSGSQYGFFGAKVNKQTKPGDQSYSFLPGSTGRPTTSQSGRGSARYRVGLPKIQYASTSSLVDTQCLENERGRSNLSRTDANQIALPEVSVGQEAHQGSAMGVRKTQGRPWNQLFSNSGDRHQQNDNHFMGTGSVTEPEQASPPIFKQGSVASGLITPPVTSNLLSTDLTPLCHLDEEVEDPSCASHPVSLLEHVPESLNNFPLAPMTGNFQNVELQSSPQIFYVPASTPNSLPGPIASPISGLVLLGAADRVHATLSQQPSIFEQGSVTSGLIAPRVTSNLLSTDLTPLYHLDEEVEDPSRGSHPVSLLEHVPELLNNFPLAPMTGNFQNVELQSSPQFCYVPASTPNNWPGPIASPISGLVLLGAADRVHAALSQQPSITESWVPTPPAMHGTIGTSEPCNLQMSSILQLRPNDFGYIGDHRGSSLNNSQCGDQNCIRLPSESSRVGSWEGDGHCFTPNYLADISQIGGLRISGRQDAPSSEQSQASNWSEQNGDGQGGERGDTVVQVSERPHIGGIYTDPDVKSIWSSNKQEES